MFIFRDKIVLNILRNNLEITRYCFSISLLFLYNSSTFYSLFYTSNYCQFDKGYDPLHQSKNFVWSDRLGSEYFEKNKRKHVFLKTKVFDAFIIMNRHHRHFVSWLIHAQ